MEKAEFYGFVNKLIIPLFTGSFIAGETESSSRDLEVALGKSNSVLLKPSKLDEYRIILKRGQPFKSFEVNLIRAILEEMTNIAVYDFKDPVYVSKLQSVAIEKALIESITEAASGTIIGIISMLESWATRTYEGSNVSAGIFVNLANVEDSEKGAVSYVDIEGARRNFEAEAQGRDFDSIHRKAVEDWNNALGCIDIEGGTEAERTIFYTALYHTMIDPRIYQDVDGRYVGGDYQVHQSDGKFVKRTVFSGWDVFRSQMPLQTIIRPQLVNDLLNSLITLADQSGRHYFERWELLNSYSGCMLGNPAVSVLADAWAKGIRDYDISKAYEYAKNSSKNTGNGSLGYSPGNLCLSHTLEYAYTDWCTGRLAEMLGKDEDAALYYHKGQAYRNIFDKKKGWFRPKDEKGNWLPWPKEGRLKEWYGCMECNPLQQGWFVPHDVKGMVGLMGGKKKVIADLDWMFGNTPQDMFWNMYYNHANEPVHFVPYLYNRLGAGWKTQYHTRYICRNAYENKVEGLRGNEDVGQMSAWYVLSAIGIHQYCPGDTRFEITSPVFRRATIHLQNGKTFTVNAPANKNN